jgi:hypothetical protein
MCIVSFFNVKTPLIFHYALRKKTQTSQNRHAQTQKASAQEPTQKEEPLSKKQTLPLWSSKDSKSPSSRQASANLGEEAVFRSIPLLST